MTDEELDALEPFMNLSDDEIEDIVIALMMEKIARRKLAKYRVNAQAQGTEPSASPKPPKTLRPKA